jgi:uncharacterized protein YaeQ
LALTATIFNFDVELADSDRHVYESLALRVAQHPSESDEYLIARVLAYLLEYQEGIEFSRGVSEPDEPTISIRDLTGKLETWIEIGMPDSARLHKASKAAARVVVYCHKEGSQWLKGLAAAALPRAEDIELYTFDRAFIGDLVSRLERRVAFSMSVNDREIYLSIGSDNLSANIARLRL